MARNFTPDKRNADGSTTFRVKRYCNGCGKSIGDVNEAELDAAIAGLPLPDVREECGCIPMTTPVVGATCTFGSGKTVWEIVKVNRNQDGTIHDLHLSKYLGDGYTNRWARPDEIRKLKAQTLGVSLAKILDLREQAENAAKKLYDAIHSKAKAEKLDEVLTAAVKATNEYSISYENHLYDVSLEVAVVES